MTASFRVPFNHSNMSCPHCQQIVTGIAARPHLGLWTLLIALPLMVFSTGAVSVSDSRRRTPAGDAETFAAVRAHLATLIVAAATLAAGGILSIVVLHMLTD